MPPAAAAALPDHAAGHPAPLLLAFAPGRRGRPPVAYAPLVGLLLLPLLLLPLLAVPSLPIAAVDALHRAARRAAPLAAPPAPATAPWQCRGRAPGPLPAVDPPRGTPRAPQRPRGPSQTGFGAAISTFVPGTSAAAAAAGLAVGALTALLVSRTAAARRGPLTLLAEIGVREPGAAEGRGEVPVTLATRRSLGREAVSIETMADATLGPAGSPFVAGAYVLQHYTLLVAYFVKAGEVLQSASGGAWPAAPGTVAFAGALGLAVYALPGRALDALNRLLAAAMGAAFAVVVATGAAQVHWEYLTAADLSAVPAIIPIVLLALVYHNVVPTICTQLRGDPAAVRKAILIGTAVPAAGFLVWDAVALGLVPYAEGVDPLRVLADEGGGALGAAVSLFSLSAIATSAIGFTLGLTDFFADSLAKRRLQNVPRASPLLLALLPPLAFALSYPKVFFDALQFAGIYGVCTLFGAAPVLMAWQSRARWPSAAAPLVPGGRPILVLLGALVALVVADDVLTRLAP